MKFMKNILFVFGNVFGFNLLFRFINRNKVRLLMYHGISETMNDYACWTILDTEKFKWQLQYIKTRYRPVSPEALNAGRSQDQCGGRHSVIITFDDGLENTYSQAWPILRQFGLKAICFVVPGLSEQGGQIWADELLEFIMGTESKYLDLKEYGLGELPLGTDPIDRAKVAEDLLSRLKLWPDEKRRQLCSTICSGRTPKNRHRSDFELMTIEMLLEIAASDEFVIGLHSNTHPIMSTLSPELQTTEIQDAINGLKTNGIKFVPVFAYPNGRPQDFNAHTKSALKECGIRAAVTTVDDLWDGNSDDFEIPRIAIGADIGKAEFKARLSGLYYFLKQNFRTKP